MATAKPKPVKRAPEEEKLLETCSDTLRETMEGFSENSETFISGMITYQRELANFFSRRISEDISMQKELLECNTFSDFAELQGRFLDRAVNQYSAEANELMKLGTGIVSKELSTISEHVKSINPNLEDTSAKNVASK